MPANKRFAGMARSYEHAALINSICSMSKAHSKHQKTSTQRRERI